MAQDALLDLPAVKPRRAPQTTTQRIERLRKTRSNYERHLQIVLVHSFRKHVSESDAILATVIDVTEE